MRDSLHLVLCLFLAFYLSACVQNPSGELHRSINNQLISSQRPSDMKRPPLYNQKYIERAQKNVGSNNFELDELEGAELDEIEDPARDNLAMYQQMLEYERMRKILAKRKQQNKTVYDTLKDSKSQLDKSKSDSDVREIALKKQIEEMKLMLEDMRAKISDQAQGGKCVIDLAMPANTEDDKKNTTSEAKQHDMCKVKPGSNMSDGRMCYPNR